MDLKQYMQEVDHLLKKINFPALWEGFHLFPFALYTEKEVCLNYKIFPKPDFFYGNTAIKYEGQITAIWNLELDPIEDISLLTANLVHEMFHCFQMEKKENRYPNDLELLFSPRTVEYCTLRYLDSKMLCQAYKTPTIDLLQNICYVRNKMLKVAPETAIHEFKAETIEGTAEYIASKALKMISEVQYLKLMDKYSAQLLSPSLQLDPRRRSYYSGVLFYHLLDTLSIPFKEFAGISIFHNVEKIIPSKEFIIQIKSILSQYIRTQEEEKTAQLQEFIETCHYVEFLSNIIGYDPMNMYQKGDLIFCKTFVRLTNGKEEREFYHPTLLKVSKKRTIQVLGYYVQESKEMKGRVAQEE